MFGWIQRFAWWVRRSRMVPWATLVQLALLHVLMILSAPLLSADDCTRDWRRAEDCLRTPGFAQGLGTTAAVIGTVLVNGAAITTLILGSRQVETQPGEEPPPQVNYSLDVMTQGQQTTIMADSGQPLWIYASVSCTDPNVNTQALTASITFAAGGANANWLSLGQPAGSGGYQAVAVTAQSPAQNAVLDPGATEIYVYAPTEGQTLTASVTIDIGSSNYEIEVF